MAVLDPVETLPETTRVLLINQRGAYIHRHAERLVVSVKGEPDAEYPLLHLEHVMVLVSAASISAEIVRECCQRGIDLTFLTSWGEPYGRLVAPGLLGTAKTRREQLLAYMDGRGKELGREMLRGKLTNQANLLKYMAKYRKDRDPDVYDGVRDASYEIAQIAEWLVEAPGDTIDEARQPLMVREAEAGRRYWAGLRLLLRPDVAWESREHRGAMDLVNSLLNYGYGILQSQVQQAIMLAGLDPFAGFVHADRPGKPSMVLDLMEEFRAPVVERAVMSALNLGLTFDIEDGRLTPASRKALAERVLDRLHTPEVFEAKRFQLGTIIQMQARAVAAFVRGDQPYRAFVARW
ncbi:MAG TPA: CRISPR-associated endonuclease Cas1 [Chloroflexota bacterium]|nr:CRISPR-associated endonuclease Cas1 [Chloroflexota bacterium]